MKETEQKLPGIKCATYLEIDMSSSCLSCTGWKPVKQLWRWQMSNTQSKHTVAQNSPAQTGIETSETYCGFRVVFFLLEFNVSSTLAFKVVLNKRQPEVTLKRKHGHMFTPTYSVKFLTRFLWWEMVKEHNGSSTIEWIKGHLCEKHIHPAKKNIKHRELHYKKLFQ